MFSHCFVWEKTKKSGISHQSSELKRLFLWYRIEEIFRLMQWAFFSNWRNAISEIAKTPKIKEVYRTPYIERALHHVPFFIAQPYRKKLAQWTSMGDQYQKQPFTGTELLKTETLNWS